MSTFASQQNAAEKSQLLRSSSNAGLLQRKCACGGSAASSLTGECEGCKSKRLQTKLSIGASNDPLEQEADRVADQVLAAPAHSVVSSSPPRIQRFTGQSTGDAGVAPDSVDRVLSGPGRPLEPTLQQDMGQRFGHDFSNVRVHTGSTAEQSARDVNANAYTVGSSIVFGAGRYAPGTHSGKHLLAHELAHVVQQTGMAEASARSSKEVARPLVMSNDKAGYATTSDTVSSNAQNSVVISGQQARQVARDTGPLPRETPLSDMELLNLLIKNRAFSFSKPGAPVEDPAGVGRGIGPQAGGRQAGDAVFAVAQITDKNGALVERSMGAYFGGGDKHAEQQALAILRQKLLGRDVEGGELTVVVDQDPCPPGRSDCAGAIESFARDFKLSRRVRVPARGNVKPRTAARGAQRTDFDPVELRDFYATKPISDSGLPKTPSAANDNSVPRGLGSANDNAVPRSLGSANDNAVPRSLGPANDNAVPRGLGPANDNAVPRGLGPANDNAAPGSVAPKAAAAGVVAEVVLGVVIELAIAIAISLILDWLKEKIEEVLIERDIKALNSQIQAKMETQSTKITRLQQQGKKVYGRITFDVMRRVGMVISQEGAIYGVPAVNYDTYAGTSLAGVDVVDEDSGSSHLKKSEPGVGGETKEHYMQTVTVLIDDPQKRARARERAELSDQLNQMAKKQRATAPAKSTQASPEPKSTQFLSSPDAVAPAPEMNFLPGAPGEGPLQKAARVTQGFETYGWTLVKMGKTIENSSTPSSSPDRNVIDNFLAKEKQWRVAIRYMRNWSVDNAPEKAWHDLDQLLGDPAKPGPQLDRLRNEFGGS